MQPFQTGIPAPDHFPTEIWARLVSRHLRDPPADVLAYGSPAGYPPLRVAIAAYLGASRGVGCTAEQVIIVGGAQSGLDLAARVLLDPGDSAWVEDPGYVGARAALMAAGAELVPVPVDGDGLDVAAGEARDPHARLAVVTPGHHYPLGSSMSLARRHQVLDWATRAGAWVVEDDYDGEFRYAGRPLAALQGLRPDGPVIYIGTFSKILFPALRLGYVVVPPELIRTFVAARLAIDVTPPTLEQIALTDFIAEGHFARHIRRMRTLYARRATTLVAAARREQRGLLDVRMPASGMNTLGMLPPGVDDREAARRAAANNVTVLPLSRCAIEPIDRGGLLLGFAAPDDEAIQAGIHRLAEALRPLVYG
jgi:GntR family transcriptional regulator/MocR family aminotransferase